MLKNIKILISSRFPKFGVNKLQTVTRLIYEISKRDHTSPEQILQNIPITYTNFEGVKSLLLKQRFPNCTNEERANIKVFPSFLNNQQTKVDLTYKKLLIDPKEFLVEKIVANSALVEKIKKLYPHTPLQIINSYNDHIKTEEFSIAKYNRRIDRIFIVKENFDFISPCPCTKDCVCCGYQILNCGMGCGFECEYCYLQSYTNAPGIAIPANIDDYLQKLGEIKHPIRIGTGQFTDSLLFDNITGYSKIIIPFLADKPHIQFEFKTKSVNIQNLLECKASPNIITAWSLNPQIIIDNCEHFTASLTERLSAAKQCQDHGYKIAFHFDPIIYFKNWEQKYAGVINQIFKNIKPENIAWISLGTLRMTIKQKQTIESRFPNNTILDEEFINGFDNKLRYNDRIREKLYQSLSKQIHTHGKNINVYLCMENKELQKI
ncbi:MAG: hypothetical protein HQL25_02040 [Candidatus Omnitrophica bacterium]|nr:hypothetical protein [Candidatus Omnitrophota bacterium]